MYALIGVLIGIIINHVIIRPIETALIRKELKEQGKAPFDT